MAESYYESLARKQEKMEKSITSCTGFLQLLVNYLNAYYGKPCILLAYEYHVPYREGQRPRWRGICKRRR